MGSFRDIVILLTGDRHLARLRRMNPLLVTTLLSFEGPSLVSKLPPEVPILFWHELLIVSTKNKGSDPML